MLSWKTVPEAVVATNLTRILPGRGLLALLEPLSNERAGLAGADVVPHHTQNGHLNACSDVAPQREHDSASGSAPAPGSGTAMPRAT